MRVPAGAPVPFWLGMRNRFPALKAMSAPSLGSMAVFTTVVVTGVAVFAVTLYPKMNNEYYKEAQAKERALMFASKDELAHGQKVWTDPFGKK